MLATILLIGLVLVATVTDLARHKIYNWTTYTGILAALGLSAAGSVWLWCGGGGESQLQSLGWIPFRASLIGLVVCGLVMLVCFVAFRVGGGDVKLIAMLGAFLGYEQGITAMLWTFVLGGCMGVIVLIWKVGPLRLAASVARQVLWTLRLGRWSPLSESERAQLQPPLYLAPSALAAVVIVRFLPADFLF
jgi:prepilin peptidase CpaA